ncbi:hypothetical protein FRB95_010487 [Tulasnella sp. JGI-2019a]|nr:hypothetical protein FRB95_010487 [Tulasnella sp. JGI-2019a]
MALTPDALITALQQHLAQHAALLPALYSQLGLAPSALTMELEQLQATLSEVVEGQLTRRRQEVDEWMAQCRVIEADCLELVKCLGQNARSSRQQSVGELRKIQVLPRRHEQLVSLKERLNQVYQTKTEQLISLNSRVQNLSRTLGPAFFPSDVLNLTLVPIQMDDELASNIPQDIPSTSRMDVTPERFQRVEKELMRGKAEIVTRLSRLSGTLELIVWFYTELGLQLPTPLDASLSLGSGNVPSSSASGGRMGQTPGSYDQILARFVARWEEAEDEALEGDTLGVEGVDPTNGVMDWAEQLKAELEQLKAHRESQIQVIFDQLEGLWRRLGVDESIVDTFVEENRGSTEETVAVYQAELDRLLVLKKASMSVFIQNAREEIIALWDDLILGEDERAEFTAFADDEYTEELLARHEEEISRLKEEKRVKAPLLAMINKYFDICDEERQLTESAADQSRLLGRGPRGDPGRLLREEKMRKRVKKEKPKLEHELLQAIPLWEDSRNRPFLVNSIRVMDVLIESVEAEAGKENKRKPVSAPAPSKPIPTRATTPGPSSTVPPSRKRAATPASIQDSNKRPKLNASSVTRTSANATPMQPSTARVVSSSGRVPFSSSNAGNRVPSATSQRSSAKAGKGTRPPPTMPPLPKMNATIGMGHPTGARRAQMPPPNSATYSTAQRTVSTAQRSVSAGVKIAAVKKRESFRPRPSMDAGVFGMGGMPNFGRLVSGVGIVGQLQEEDEDVF